jgi:AraC-like DNA-binding protein
MKKLPSNLLGGQVGDLSVFNYNIENILNRSKVVIDQYVLSFLIQGHKEINFGGSSIHVDNSKALLIAPGNYLMTEKGYGSDDYSSILIFFSKAKLSALLTKKAIPAVAHQKNDATAAYFVIEQDEFVKSFIDSLSLHFKMNRDLSSELMEVKFEEIMIYLLNKYGEVLVSFLWNTLQHNNSLIFRKTIEANKHNNLRLGELAFLCHMSLSTFKRHFTELYNQSPGTWFKQRRLERSQQLLKDGSAKPSDVYELSGYKNHAHFSTAYKAAFGKSPKYALLKD